MSERITVRARVLGCDDEWIAAEVKGRYAIDRAWKRLMTIPPAPQRRSRLRRWAGKIKRILEA